MDVPLLRLFTYGTLKRGGSNFERFCGGAARVHDATVIGRLHFFPPHYPILDVPPEHVMGDASRRLSEDILKLSRTPKGAPVLVPLVDGWRRIRGEVVEFEGEGEVEQRLARIDWLEDFDVDGPMSYRRVIVPVEREDGRWLPAWTYVVPPNAKGRYPVLDTDNWTE